MATEIITQEELHDLELQAPEYAFVERGADEETISPIKLQIAKIQNTASTFSLYDVYKLIGSLDRLIDEKEAEIAKHKQNKELFLAEIALIEKALGVSEMEKQYQAEVTAEVAVAEALKANDKDTETN